MVNPVSAARSRKLHLGFIALGVVVVLVAVLVGGELYARHRVAGCLSSQFRKELDTGVKVSLGTKPVLLEMIDRKVPSVEFENTGNKFGPATGMKVNAEVHDVELVGDNQHAGTVAGSSAHVVWSTEGIIDTMKGQMFGALISDAQTDPATGTIVFQLGHGLAQLVVQPKIVGSSVQVLTKDAALLGFGLPTDLVDGVVKTVGESLQNYPIGMTPKSLKVTATGIDLTLTGGRYELIKGGPGSHTCDM